MNATTTERPPAQPAAGNGEHFDMVAIKLSIDLVVTASLPAGNLIGSIILRTAISRALRNKNLLLEDFTMFAGPLNDSFYLAKVTKTAPALAVLESVLAETQLRCFATVLFLNLSEDYFIPVGADNARIGCTFTFARVLEASQRSVNEQSAVLEFMQRLQAALKKTPPTPPADPQA